MKLSFIVPLYNTERFIVECLESLYEQELAEEDFEVIVVNDGSTDAGPERVTGFAATKTNCRMVNQRNGGLSAARNSGLRVAKGEYVMFVDSDDYLLSDSISPFLEKLEMYDLDFIRGEKIEIDYDGAYLAGATFKKCSGACMGGAQFGTLVLGHDYYAWLYLVKRSFLEHEQLTFREDIRLCEDVHFSIHMCHRARRAMYLAKALYAYRQNNPHSILATAVNQSKLLDYVRVLVDIQGLKNSRMNEAVERAVSRGVCMILYWCASLPQEEQRTVIRALQIPAFSRIGLYGSLRFKGQGLIYNLFSARGFLFFKRLMDFFRS